MAPGCQCWGSRGVLVQLQGQVQAWQVLVRLVCPQLVVQSAAAVVCPKVHLKAHRHQPCSREAWLQPWQLLGALPLHFPLGVQHLRFMRHSSSNRSSSSNRRRGAVG